jgi:hypothetical protein
MTRRACEGGGTHCWFGAGGVRGREATDAFGFVIDLAVAEAELEAEAEARPSRARSRKVTQGPRLARSSSGASGWHRSTNSSC